MIVSIIGAGTMGSGIAQVAATAGEKVLIYDTREEALNEAEKNLDKILTRLVEKDRISAAEKERIQSNIDYVDTLRKIKKSDLVIEAIVEDLEVKQQVFSTVEKFVSDSCIL